MRRGTGTGESPENNIPHGPMTTEDVPGMKVAPLEARNIVPLVYVWPLDQTWVCLKIGDIPNYSHLVGIMIINHWV